MRGRHLCCMSSRTRRPGDPRWIQSCTTRQVVPTLVVVNDPQWPQSNLSMFRVPPNFQGEMRFKFVWAVDIVDPANMVVERFTAQQPGSGFRCRVTCAKSGKLGYSFRQDAGDKIRISLDIRNRTVVECLNAAAAAAGLEGILLARRQRAQAGCSRRSSDNRVFIPDLLKTILESRNKPGPTADSPGDAACAGCNGGTEAGSEGGGRGDAEGSADGDPAAGHR